MDSKHINSVRSWVTSLNFHPCITNVFLFLLPSIPPSLPLSSSRPLSLSLKHLFTTSSLFKIFFLTSSLCFCICSFDITQLCTLDAQTGAVVTAYLGLRHRSGQKERKKVKEAIVIMLAACRVSTTLRSFPPSLAEGLLGPQPF